MKSEGAWEGVGVLVPKGLSEEGEESFEGKNRPLDKLLHSRSRDDVLYRYRVRDKKFPLCY
jgi:hypothetical protein